MTMLSRRGAMSGAIAVAASAAVAPLNAAAPPIGNQAPGFYRYRVGDIEITVVNDGVSRMPITDDFVANASKDQVNAALEAAFRRYGLPLAMLTDWGSPWGDAGGELTGLAAWLMRLGVRLLHGRPRHPETQGKQERFHRTLKAEALSGRSFRDLAACQRAFDAFRLRYNHERPHEALGMAVPATRYRASARPFPEVLPPIDYAPGDLVRKVDGDGFISFRNRPWRIGKALRGEITGASA